MDLSFHSYGLNLSMKGESQGVLWGLFWFCFLLCVAGFENRVQSILPAPEATELILKMMENGENEKKVFSFPFVFF